MLQGKEDGRERLSRARARRRAEARENRHPLRHVAFELRLKLLLAAVFVLPWACCLWLLRALHAGTGATAGVLLLLVALGAVPALLLLEGTVRPLQTLANVLAALREDDYAFRARGERHGDALGELAWEINALADQMQAQRMGALDATALLRRVVESLETPVLAFDLNGALRLINPAAERVFSLQGRESLGLRAETLGIDQVLRRPEEGILALPGSSAAVRWMVHRTSFRQGGVPHTLLLLSDVSAALREEERAAWQKLIRVLGHEINNSLAPIKSLAGSLRGRLPAEGDGHVANGSTTADLRLGLEIIEGRAESLHRFVEAYRQLAQLPPPRLAPVELRALLQRTCSMETRVAAVLVPGPELTLCVDRDQVEQMMINLLRNAAEAALGVAGATGAASETALPMDAPAVWLSWCLVPDAVEVRIEDNGPGLSNSSNLFVPFYTTKPGGTGVGLVLARQIAEAHGGSVVLTNREVRGCRATVVLPLAGVQETSAGAGL